MKKNFGERMKCKSLGDWLVIVIISSILLTPLFTPVKAETIFFYAGPDLSEDLLQLKDFSIIGSSSLKIGDSITVKFNLTNLGQYDVDLGADGIFAAAKDPDNVDTSFGFSYAYTTMEVMQTLSVNVSKVLTKKGTWKIWPSYHISLATGEKYGPYEWHACNITVEPTEGPADFIVKRVTCDWENGRIGYVIKNIGGETAMAGHTTTLYVNGSEISNDLVDVNLEPGESYESLFREYSLPNCTTINVKVCTDTYNQTYESNEENNCIETTFECEETVIPHIIITSGPTVTQVTQSTVLICWDTDIESNSLVRYGIGTVKYSNFIEDSNLVKEHCFTLTKLEPATTYRFMIESTDSSGNKVKSRDLSFETLSLSDEEKPSLSLVIPDTLSGKAILSADAEDNIDVDRVVFFCDGKQMFTDYSAPFEWECDTGTLDEGVHMFTAQTFDIFGNTIEVGKESTVRYPIVDPTAPTIAFLNPHHEDDVFSSVRIEALIEDSEGYIQKAEMYIDGVLVRRWVYNPFVFELTGGELEVVPNPPKDTISFIYFWDTNSLDFNSEHLIEVRAWDDSENYNYNTIRVRKPPLQSMPPDYVYSPEFIDIQVTRNVVKGTNGNWFEVWLTVRNTGTITLRNLQIRDACAGFQAIALSSDTTVDYNYFNEESLITIIPTMGELRPGETWTFLYHVVPILFSPYNDLSNDEYVIGLSRSGWKPQVLCMYDEGSYQHFIELPFAPANEDLDGDGLNELDAAFKSADYLIVTSEVLFRDADYAGVDLLLQKAATLAREKRGVLGYWYPSPYDHDSWQYAYARLKEYITPGVPNPSSNQGYWASRLSDAFSHPDVQDAYLLLIGEWDVIPSATYNVHDLNIRWSDGGRTDTVKLSDNFYADTVGHDNIPDLIVGRIIGNTPKDLIKPIWASLNVTSGHGFDRSFALTASGYEDCSGDSFNSNAQNIAGDLMGQGVSCETLHWGTFIEHGWGLPLTYYDAFTLGDVDGDGIDEVIIAKDEESKIYIYEPADRSLIEDFICEFTRYDGLAAGDLDGDGRDEIVIARDDDSMIYVYEPNGTLIDSYSAYFDNWDALATGDVLSDSKDEVVIMSERGDRLKIYKLIDTSIWGHEGWELREETNIELNIDFTRYDGFVVGNVLGDSTSKDEIVIARDDNNEIYIYSADGWQLDHFDARFTPYDGFAIGDVDDDNMDEMVVIIDEDNEIYIYDDNGKYYDTDEDEWTWKRTKMYSRSFDDWFHGIRYTGSPTRHDGFAIGNVIPGENPKIVILHIREDWGSFEVLISTWRDADEWANVRLSRYVNDISILAVSGHGDPNGASPIGCNWAYLWGNFTKHPFVFSMSCLTGDYESWGQSFGECLFNHGAAVFIGSTEVSAGSQNSETIRKYFDNSYTYHWDIWNERAGKAFNRYERHRVTQGNWWKFWVYEYNYYGDPKFPFGG